jgi:ADP-dependent NAD(P)H-hydrate dehydratase / NAD(P)H-hydrate epimerase
VKLVTVAEMQQAERECGVPIPQLMENAGLAVAQEAWLMLGELADRKIVVLAGPGNNGGDGLVAARHLKDWGADVTLFLLKPRGEDDSNLAALVEREIPISALDDDATKLDEALAGAELIIDALLGTGRAREVEGPLASALDRLRDARSRRLPSRLLAVDLPTGVDADTGAVDPHTVAADQTVALGWSKVGLHTLPGAQYAGRVEVVDIGIAPEHGTAIQTELITASWARSVLPERPPDAHKGTFGSALIVAGSPQYVGAAALSSTGALRVGTGIVTLACARSVYPMLASKLTETTFEPLDDKDGFLSAEEAYSVRRALSRGYEALLVGPGLAQGAYVVAFMRALLPMLTPEDVKAVVIDADGLNNIAKVDRWWEMLNVPAVITPHPGELSRLAGIETAEIQRDRLAAARRCAAEWGVTIVLKGANTIVAAPDGRSRLSPFANPGLASGGTGDVLAGAITGFIAQDVEPFDAASLGVYLHGLAAELVRRELGDAGMLAGDVASALPRAIRELRGE